LQCASHRNLGWKISVMDTIDVDAIDVDSGDKKFNITIVGSGVGVQGSIFSLLLPLALLCLLTY
jgi:hypothetical protein